METKPKKPRGRNGGMKSRLTWRQRFDDDPNGATPALVNLPHELGRRLEWKAAQEGTTVQKLLLQFAEKAMIQELIV